MSGENDEFPEGTEWSQIADGLCETLDCLNKLLGLINQKLERTEKKSRQRRHLLRARKSISASRELIHQALIPIYRAFS